MDRYPHIAAMVYGSAWAIVPAKLGVILDALTYLRAGGQYTAEEVRAVVGGGRSDRRRSGSVAIVPVYGTIANRASMLTESSGGTSVERIRQDFRAAMDDAAVSAIVLDIDSPGGTVHGVPELASEIRAAAHGPKPIVAVANPLAASAAYWLGSQADEFVSTPSGEVGSIGVVAAHQDISGAQEREGVKTTLVSAGKYKTEGSPYAPLDDEAHAAIQERVNEYYSQFVAAVAAGRGEDEATVRAEYGEGRVLSASQAKRKHMVDRVETLEQTIARLESTSWRRPARGTRAELERQRLLIVG